MRRVVAMSGLVALAVVMLQTTAAASEPVAVPEITGSISAGMALLAGGVLMLRARRRK